jgi:outer membrane protein
MRTIPFLLIGVTLAAITAPAACQSVAQTAAPAATTTAPPTETLRDALVRAYGTNPQIAGARDDLRATDESVPIARASGLPGVAATTGVSRSVYNSQQETASIGPSTQATAGLNLNVPVFQGGAVRNSVRAAETRVEAGRASLRGTEADLFTQVVSAYMDVIRNESVVRLNQENVHVLEVNLQATRDRFEVGDLTRTDVAQSEARLAVAQGQLRGAEAQLIGARETYIQVVGTPPGILAQPPALPNLPADPTSAVSIALEENPTLLSAIQSAKAAGFDVRVARAGRLPQVTIGVGNNYYNYLGSVGNPTLYGGNDGISSSANVQLSLPIFQGGAPAARIRQAQARRSSALENVTLTERAVVAQARGNFAAWQSAQRVIESSEVAVKANQLSLEGVRAENSVGSRTILDILNAEQELLNSQVTLVTARRDAYVAGFALLAAMGRAEADDLGLNGGSLYDPSINYRQVHHRNWDWGGPAAPAITGTPTKDTPVQTPDVRQDSLDPILQQPVDTGGRNPAGGNN